MTNTEIESKGNEILKQAEETGVIDNFFFKSTFDRYLYQLKLINQLQDQIDNSPTVVEQTYVKGRSNFVVSPCIRGYNSLCSEANKTMNVLLKIVESFGKSDKKDTEEDVLLNIINGSSDNDED